MSLVFPAPNQSMSAGLSNVNTNAQVTERLVTGRCRVFRVLVFNNNAAARTFQIFDSAAAVADGQTPLIARTVAAGADSTFDFGIYGRDFRNGFYICNSSTAVTKTIGAADSLIDVQVITQSP